MNINFNFEKTMGKIKAMHGIGQPPMVGVRDDLFHYISEAGMPYSRLHDVGGAYGGNLYVDIHNIFRDFDADVEDESSYDFAFTDILMQNLQKHNCEPIFRLGETIENYHYIKAYRIFPPKDNLKWARICEHIIKHYNYGWANGFEMNIKYWEIWNEPDNGRDYTENQMWHGTPEEYYEMYTVASKHLKKCFGDAIKIGGPATCGFRHILSDPEKYGVECEKSDDECYKSGRSENFIKFVKGFFEYIKKNNAPLDFFSWHSYLSTENTVVCAGYAKKLLKEYGFENVETQLNEWNNVCEDRGDPTVATKIAIEERGTGIAAAKTVSMMCAMQNTDTDILCYYDAGVGPSYYRGMFDPKTKNPEPLYYAFPAFNELYTLGNQAEISTDKCKGIYSLAASKDGKKAVIVANTSGSDTAVTTNLDDDMKFFAVDDDKTLTEVTINPKSFVIPNGCFYLIKNY